MADTQTTNLNLTKPEPGAAEDTWGISLNADLDALDAIFSSTGTQINLNPNQINFADNKKAVFGNSSDLQIYHDTLNSYIKDVGTGNLIIEGSSQVKLTGPAGDYFMGQNNGSAYLYYAGQLKAYTTSTGIDVTGVITTDGLTTSADINFGDDDKALFGAGNDLKIYHSANNQSYIHETGTGDLNILATNLKLQDAGGSTKVLVNSTGIDVTGTVTSGGLTVAGNAYVGSGNYFTDATSGYFFGGNGSYANGIYGVGVNNVAIKANNAERIRIASNGDIAFYEDTGSSQAFFWDASAEALGIGTTSIRSNYSLDVRNAGNSGVNIQAGDEAADIVLSVGSAGTPDKFVVTSGGKIGIGTNNPSTALEVNSASAGATVATFEGTYSGSGDVKLASFERVGGAVAAAVTYADASTSMEFGTTTSHSLHLTTGDTARLTIDNSGNVLVGTTSPSAKLFVEKGDTGNAFGVRATNATYGQTVGFFGADRNTTNNTFHYIDCYNYGSNSYRFRVADSGNVTNTNNSYGAISDIKLKENIIDATPKLEKLNKVRVVNYNFIGSEEKQLGVIAQELEQIMPNMVDENVDTDADGNELGTTTKTVKYSVFVPMLIKAIQEQQTQIESLKGEIANLKGE